MRTREIRHLDRQTTELSVAVTLLDSTTGRIPSDPPTVRLRDLPESVVRNRTGHFLITDLPAAAVPVTVVIEGDGAHLPETITVGESSYEPPVHECVPLLPAPTYPFTATTTLLRGTVAATGSGGEDELLADVDLSLVGPEEGNDVCDDEPPKGLRARGRTDDRGEYVLPVQGITQDDVLDSYPDEGSYDGPPVVHTDDAKPEIRATRPDTGDEVLVETPIVEGETTELDVAF